MSIPGWSLLLERRLVFFLEQIHLLSFIVFFRANPGHVKPPRLAMRPLLFLPDGPMARGGGGGPSPSRVPGKPFEADETDLPDLL